MAQRGRVRGPLLVGSILALTAIEVWLLIAVASRITVPGTLALLVAEAALGGWLMRREGGKAWRALAEAVQTGRVPSGEIAEAALVFLGGVLLILPGLITDIIGLICLLPLTRPLARRMIGGVLPAPTAQPQGFAENIVIVPGDTVPEGEPGTGVIVETRIAKP